MQDALDELIELLDLEAIEVNLFRGTQPDEDRQRVFGGQVAGQALVAAARTVDETGRHVHSLHSYFLRPGDPNVPILYEVDRIRDGRSFTTRRVVGIQHGQAIFNLAASFHDPEPGLDYHPAGPRDVPGPDELPTLQERLAPFKDRLGPAYDKPRPIDMRYAPPDPFEEPDTPTERQHVWLRADGRLPDDPVLHACVITYASDMTLLDATLRPFGKSSFTSDFMMASLDHAMWFHRPFRADEWLLYSQTAISTSGARGLAGGQIYTASGHLAISVAQEGLIRPIDRR